MAVRGWELTTRVVCGRYDRLCGNLMAMVRYLVFHIEQVTI